MGIENKQTYGEYYWAMQVEAAKFFDEETEKTFAPFFAEMIDEILHTAMNPMMKIIERALNRGARETWLTSEQANTLLRRGKVDLPFWKLILSSEGYEDALQRFHYISQTPYPSIPDLTIYSRYHGDPDNPWIEIQKWFDIDATDWKVWNWLGLQRLTTMQVQTLFRRGLITEPNLLNQLAQIGWSPSDRVLVKELGWSMPNAMLLVQGGLQQQLSKADILRDISIADINPKYAQQYLDAILTKPASQDIIAYELRKDPDLSDLPRKLQRIGIHPEYTELYKELAYVIPPVADIITMAVREAFTPEIAARFGQYQDYPKQLEEWAVKKGLSREWSERYWAAHWSLPSASQGFEMLHRGLISRPELDMLLRALDVMPFWRDKLTGIAYRRLSRVDIRRMYGVGEVYEAYLELGYNERDARRMSDFTVKQILATQSKFTARDIISAYSKYMLDRGEARSLLLDVGVKSENIDFIISTAEYKRSWELTESRIAAIRNLYKKEVYTPDKARSELLRLNLPAERVDVLMAQWYIDERDKAPRYWTTAQTLSFIKDELITPTRGRKELENIGYDAEHINVYMKASK